ncbi:MAG: monofunctional biosynthetic peptidoglycan transglycosylase [Alphaproteobacteria bacterium]|nr:monofunctional biosynthetic peptidoglycan transglycosylase [Alphaproteobacteria bacterium]
MPTFHFILRRYLWPWVLTMLGLVLALQLFFALRIAAMAWLPPSSTAFERTELWRLSQEQPRFRWHQTWVQLDRISVHLQRAVIVSEDDLFLQHDGVQWQALEKAWHRNERASAQAQRQGRSARLVGGSTITQQLAKNLFLSGERTLLRKGQELVLTHMLEVLLSKRRILEIYLNHVEWGEGIFGAQAAAQHYFSKDAAKLSEWEAARLAVMLPRPKWFEKNPNSPYWADRSEVILSRMAGVKTP